LAATTTELKKMAKWLTHCGIRTVALHADRYLFLSNEHDVLREISSFLA
jgi:hypothetical protein